VFDSLMSMKQGQEVFRRPILKCKFEKIEVKTLYDTGACVSCISQEVYDRLEPHEKKRGLKVSERYFLSASGTRMKALGTLNLIMSVKGQCRTRDVCATIVARTGDSWD